MTLLRRNNSGHSIRITLLLVPLLALILAGCDLESIEAPQLLVESTPTVVATASPEPQLTATPEASPTSIPSAGGSTVPGAGGAPRTYTVQPGDTLSQIAEQFDVTTAELMAANDISSADFLQIDQVLTIPSAESTG